MTAESVGRGLVEMGGRSKSRMEEERGWEKTVAELK